MNWKILLLVPILAWGALYFSGSGVLIGETTAKASTYREGDRLDAETLINALSQLAGGGMVLECRYFVGTRTIRQVHPYDPNGSLGRAACPRLIQL